MANVPEDLHYSKDHEWVRVDGDEAIIGITDYAQNSLGDVVYVELPKTGDEFAANESFGSVESVKAVSEVFTPSPARGGITTGPWAMKPARAIPVHSAAAGSVRGAWGSPA